MASYTLKQMFVDLLREAMASERLFLDHFPSLLVSGGHQHLREALDLHIQETKEHVKRLQQIAVLLRVSLEGGQGAAMQGLLQEAKNLVGKATSPAVRDACLIITVQKIEHYEMAVYGSAYSLASSLAEASEEEESGFEQIAEWLEEILEEECMIDERLTEIAEGGFMSPGLNEEAQKE